jgi:hypothetical protein
VTGGGFAVARRDLRVRKAIASTEWTINSYLRSIVCDQSATG